MSIEWSTEAIIARKNNSTFFSHFTSLPTGQQYSCGSITTVKIDRKILLAEITHIWLTSSAKDSNGQVRLRLYSRPEDLPHGRTHYHGEHELLLFYKPAILTCPKFLSIEQQDSCWSLGLSLQPLSTPPSEATPSPLSSASSSTTALLYCNESMIPVGGFHDHMGVSPVTSPVIARSVAMPTLSRLRLRILSYSAYCRYRAIRKRFEPNSFEYMIQPLVQAMGGIPVPDVQTAVLFCRKNFRDMSLERKILILEGVITLADLKYEEQLSGNDRDGPLPFKRKRGRPRKTEQQLIPKENQMTVAKRKRGRPRKTPLPLDESRSFEHQTDSTTYSQNGRTNDTIEPIASINSSTPSTSTSDDSMLCTTQYNNSNSTNCCSSEAGGPLETDEPRPLRPLRPRSMLQLPPQYRDSDVYDVNLVESTSSASPKKAPTIIKQPMIEITVDPKPPPPPPAYVTPQVPPSSSRVTVPMISPDVKQLLRAHLSRLQEAPPNGVAWSKTLLSSLEDHLLEEKAFLDLLFCFMKMRNTPIHRVPRLGSKYLNLYDLFRSTAQMGGYDQVTLNRKWSSVFDCMGCSTGMTCASTVTRKHYEKLLLPFEKALTAMKQTTKNFQT